MPYFKIEQPKDMEVVFLEIMKIEWPYILEVMTSNRAIVEPKMLYWNTIDKQSPPLSIEVEEKIQELFI